MAEENQKVSEELTFELVSDEKNVARWKIVMIVIPLKNPLFTKIRDEENH